jgi:putative peptidoglycan binding protein/penicillin-insensitive murein endopeptidase
MVTFRRVVTAAVAAAATAVLLVPSADAYENAFFHPQSEGNRGVDVTAIQYLLTQQGQQVEPTGVFESTTDSAVRAFQTKAGLPSTGVVDAATWEALAPRLEQGATGAAVNALQTELAAKLRKDVPVTGQFDAATTEAVRTFQDHAGIGVDGIVGAATWRNLVWHYDYPDLTGMCDQDPDGNGDANWATAAAIGQLEAAAKSFADTGQGEVPLGDAGFEHGGDIPGHGSHDNGMDIDIWPIRTDNGQCTEGRIIWSDPEYDREATRTLAKTIRDTAPGHVKLIFFNDPQLIEEGLTTEYPNHDNHLHVRYCEPGHPNSTYAC